MTTLTTIQFHCAYSLAAAHGHLWAIACQAPPADCEAVEVVEAWRAVDEALAAGTIELAAIDRLTAADVAGEGRIGGIYCPEVDDAGIVMHVTGTGRLTWAVHRDGAVEIEVSRPIHAARERGGEIRQRVRDAETDLAMARTANDAYWASSDDLPDAPLSPELRMEWRKYREFYREAERDPQLFAGAHTRTTQALRAAAQRLIERLRSELPQHESMVVLRARIDRRGRATVQRLGDAHARHVDAIDVCLRALGVDDRALAAARRACPDAAQAADESERYAAELEASTGGDYRGLARRAARLWREAAAAQQRPPTAPRVA